MKMETMPASLNSALSDNTISVTARFCNAREKYEVTIPSNMTVEQLKRLLVGRFVTPAAAVANQLPQMPADQMYRTPTDHMYHIPADQLNLTPAEQQTPQYLLLHADQRRKLADESSLAQEDVRSGANLLLLERPQQVSQATRRLIQPDDSLDALRRQAEEQGLMTEYLVGGPPSEDEIRRATADVPYEPRVASTNTCSCRTLEVHGKHLLLRRILLGMAHCSLRHLGDARSTQDAFLAILDKLERRHRSSMKPDSIKKLKDMGFSEAKAVIALKFKSSVEEAAGWLTDNDPHKHLPSTAPFVDLTDADDPVEVLMPRFWHFRRTFFVPHTASYERLVGRGFSSTRVFDALMQAENDETLARDVLEEERKHNCDLLYTPPPPHHPIMASIMAASVVQVALQKPKVLYALLALCSNPSNANLWLSDPDTTGVINLILKLYHEERYNIDCCHDLSNPSSC
ncbi:uncharacterized protein LOC108665089 [Hyalella azteca]|uniref:Uncharacterized protein LOC108665089 n=1 Tax=Hyalella azteca TaxID=294128 RepID=A0A8B7N172_HYAAZ|nr:uncharacterized protein LOC108665089 [Hyalella azteca]